MAIAELNTSTPFQFARVMQKLCTAFECLILKSCCNLSGTLDFDVFVIIVAHAHLQLLNPAMGLSSSPDRS